MRSVVALTSLLCVLSLSAHPRAQEASAEAANAFQNGIAAYQRADYAAAARAFERAYSLRPHAAALFNRARALERLGDASAAADDYDAALARGELRQQDNAECRSRLQALSETLGTVHIAGSPTTRVSIGALQRVPLPLRAHLSTGRYELSLWRADGARATMTAGVAAGKLTELQIPERGAPWATARTVTPRLLPTERRFTVPAAGYACAGAAVLATATGVYLGISGIDARDDFDASGHADQNAHHRAVRLRAFANVAFGVAVVAGATAGVLVYRASTRPIRVTLRGSAPAPGGARLALGISAQF